jgi:hypothetical protein
MPVMRNAAQEREIAPYAARMGHGLALRKFDGGDGPLAIVAPDRDSQTVKLVKPNLLHGPGLSVGEDYRLADKLSLRLLERAEDRGHSESHGWHG